MATVERVRRLDDTYAHTCVATAALAGQTSSARAGSPPEENIQDVPVGLAGIHGGKNHLTQPLRHDPHRQSVRSQAAR